MRISKSKFVKLISIKEYPLSSFLSLPFLGAKITVSSGIRAFSPLPNPNFLLIIFTLSIAYLKIL